ncbi:Cubilin, partial [Trichoplax sp. H2]
VDVPCVTQTYQGNLGIIKSPHFPQPFPVPSCSIYRIQVPAGRVIKLTWNKFSISPNVPVSSCLNYIELYDRWLKSENKIYKFCSGDKLPPSFTSSSNTVYLTFTASTISSLNSGFEGVYRSITRDVCNIKSETPTGAITVPNNPSYLHLDLDCFVTINIIDIDYIILRWVEFGPQLFDNPSLCKNYIAIYNGLINSTDLIMSLKMCQEGNATTLPVKSKNLINVRYRVWDYNHLKNFRFFYIGVSSQQLQKKIKFSNASCEDIEWYYEAPFGNVVVESTLSCKEPASKLATWVMIVIFCGVGLASTVLIIVSGCLLARYLQRSRQRYQNL